MPNTAISSEFSRYSRTHDFVDLQEAKALISAAREMNSQSGCCGISGKKGDKELARLVKENSDKFDPQSLATISNWLKNHSLSSSTSSSSGRTNASSTIRPSAADPANPFGKVIIDWKAEKSTWECHWWPMQEANAPGGDPYNNLYAAGGALQKYDAAFGRNSRSVELANNAKAFGSGSAFSWWGHCNNASQVACLLREPVRDVTYNGVTFTAHDIQGLLVKVVPSLASGEDMVGSRDNDGNDDPNEPYPAVFMDEVLKKWCVSGQRLPFIFDIDPQGQVWNYPFDKVKVYESDKAPPAFAGSVPSAGRVKFYRAEISGTGYEDEVRHYEFWIQYDSSGKKIGSAWISAPDGDGKPNPDFCWRPKHDRNLDSAQSWVTNAEAQNNPEVRAEDVFKIYKMSIA